MSHEAKERTPANATGAVVVESGAFGKTLRGRANLFIDVYPEVGRQFTCIYPAGITAIGELGLTRAYSRYASWVKSIADHSRRASENTVTAVRLRWAVGGVQSIVAGFIAHSSTCTAAALLEITPRRDIAPAPRDSSALIGASDDIAETTVASHRRSRNLRASHSAEVQHPTSVPTSSSAKTPSSSRSRKEKKARVPRDQVS